MMRAAIYKQYGEPDVLQVKEAGIPEPGPDEVLIRIKASSVSAGDWHMRKADPWAVRLFNGLLRPKIQILGSEFAGVVESIGTDVTHFKVGDEVFGATGLKLGANAEYLCLKEKDPLVHKPNAVSFDEAAAIPFGAITALHFLKDIALIKPGQKLLVHGASGAVGLATVQLGRYFGADVTGVCSGRNKELVLSAGAHQVIDYQQENFADSKLAPWDLVLDTTGQIQFHEVKGSLQENGQFLAVAGGLRDFLAVLKNKISLALGMESRQIRMSIAVEDQKGIHFIADRIKDSSLKPIIDRVYSLEEIARAHAYVETGRKVGSVIIQL